MTLRTWIAATMLATAALPARGEEAAQGATSELADTAIVLATAPDEVGARAWVKRWKKVSALYSDLFGTRRGFPEIVPGRELALPGTPAEPFAVVLGYCSAGEAAPRLDLLRSIYAEARAVKAPPRSGTCPILQPGAHLVQRKTIERNGWRLVLGQYLKDPMPADVPVGRKVPRDPAAGMMVLVPALFDPDGLMAQYRGPFTYRCITDELEWPNTCNLEISVEGSSITVDVQWSQRPHPCSGDLSRLHVRSVFTHAGKELSSKEDVLEKKSAPRCD